MTQVAVFFLLLASLCAAASFVPPEWVAWSELEREGTLISTDIHFGLRTTYDKKADEADNYDCSSDFCDVCRDSGDAAFSFMIIGALVNLIAMLLANRRLGNGSTKLMAWLTAGACAGLYGVAWSTWLGGCHEELKSFYGDLPQYDPDDVEVSLGFGFSVAASVLSGVSALLVCMSNDWIL